MDRRHVLRGLGGALSLASLRAGGFARAAEAPLATGLPEGLYDTAALEALPGKRPLIRLTTRPPNYETPQSHFAEAVTPNDAFFVRCDRSTMTQDDLDNGRLICLIGVAPVKPAEFVIIRSSQKTGECDRGDA